MWFNVQRSGLDVAQHTRFRFQNEAVLDATPDAVFELLATPETWRDWFPDFVSAHWVTEPPHGVGSVRQVRLKLLGVRERFIAWEPGKRWAFTLEQVTLPIVSRMVEDYRLDPVGENQCRLNWVVHYQPKLALRPLHPVIRPVFAKMFKDGIASLQTYVREHLRSAA